MFKKFLMKRAMAVADSRPPDFAIGPKEDPYMLRWWWIPRNRFFNAYIHIILHDDDDRALHDHPWASLSLLCRGRIHEHYKENQKEDTAWRTLCAGQWVYRSSRFAHRLTIGATEMPMTIFFTGPRIREWGFHCANGWRHWKDFVSSEGKGEVGIGCGEMDGPSKAPKIRKGFFK